MKSLALFSACLLCLAACAETVSETGGTFTYRGETYPTTTRQFQRSDGSTYSRMTIRAGAERVSCMPDDPRDCESALQQIDFRHGLGV
ncbi:hypothetical protein KUV51_14280 [Tateyamaria omphalii]|uniref:hypothetical protein n=1 Tax=Tateyamaria omphalii TaxID=299262 RepID=UPI001C99B719|nr:hypothetical protein [Tateyamaria omphalii]MBY5934172.1 hypothetical protein [Tateyamaria omphalii]